METTHSESDAYSAAEFYLPGTFQFSGRPGRIERLLGRVLRDRTSTVQRAVDAGGNEFYLPATPAFRRHGSR